eukprot:15459942-Alexandrium_andersonii.AAC.1
MEKLGSTQSPKVLSLGFGRLAQAVARPPEQLSPCRMQAACQCHPCHTKAACQCHVSMPGVTHPVLPDMPTSTGRSMRHCAWPAASFSWALESV